MCSIKLWPLASRLRNRLGRGGGGAGGDGGSGEGAVICHGCSVNIVSTPHRSSFLQSETCLITVGGDDRQNRLG